MLFSDEDIVYFIPVYEEAYNEKGELINGAFIEYYYNKPDIYDENNNIIRDENFYLRKETDEINNNIVYYLITATQENGNLEIEI